MTFWLVVAAVVLVMLLLSWRHDRKRRGSVRGDMKHQINGSAGANRGKDEQAVTQGMQRFRGPR